MQFIRHMVGGTVYSVLYVCALTTAIFALEPTSREKPLRWKSQSIKISISRSLLDQPATIKGNIPEAIEQALDSWAKAAPVSFTVSESELLNVSNSGVRGDGISLITVAATAENVRLFPKQADSPQAITRTFSRFGFITEADIILNPYVQFSTDGSYGTYDLQSTIMHEIGHFLGLEHSDLLSSTMFERTAPNGFIGAQGFLFRTLARNDIASIRGLYGAPVDDFSCCGSFAGKIKVTWPKSIHSAEIWAEDAESGRVYAATRLSPNGSFDIGGLPEGRFRVMAQGFDSTDGAAVQIGESEIKSDEEILLGSSPATLDHLAGLEFIGLNGQISRSAVLMTAGQTVRLYVGGKGLNSKEAIVGIRSPYFTTVKGSRIDLDYNSSVSVISVEILIDPNTPEGEYNVYIEAQDGRRRYLIGAVSID